MKVKGTKNFPLEYKQTIVELQLQGYNCQEIANQLSTIFGRTFSRQAIRNNLALPRSQLYLNELIRQQLKDIDNTPSNTERCIQRGALIRILMPRWVAANKHTKIQEAPKKAKPIIIDFTSEEKNSPIYKALQQSANYVIKSKS